MTVHVEVIDLVAQLKAVRPEAESPEVTILHDDVDAQIGGKLAQLGARLIDSTARKLAGEFFAAFATKVGALQDQTIMAKTG